MDSATGFATHDRSEVMPALDSPATAYLEALSREQARFLSATMEARRRLGDGAGQLAAVAALHGRLTQQFFDAQRAILRRRAENDSRVRSIGEAVDVETDAMLAVAQVAATHPSSHSVSRSSSPDLPVDECASRDVSEVDDVRSVRQQIADLATSVVRSGHEAQAFAAVINDAFVPDEPDGASAQRQLQEVLDEWWQSENQENRAAIDDATARAAMRLHVAKLEAVELAGFDIAGRFEAGQLSVDVEAEREVHVTPEPAMKPAAAQVEPNPDHEMEPEPDVDTESEIEPEPDVEPEPEIEREPDIEFEPAAAGIAVFDEPDVDAESCSEEPADDVERARPAHAVTPTSMSLLEALDHTDHVGLDAVLAALLDAPNESAEVDSPHESVVSTTVPAISIEAPRDEPFDQFWAGTVVLTPATQPRRWVSTQVMLPAAAIVGLAAAVLAWIG